MNTKLTMESVLWGIMFYIHTLLKTVVFACLFSCNASWQLRYYEKDFLYACSEIFWIYIIW